VLQLEGDRGAAMEDANLAMTKHCGSGNFVIVQEGEEAIGTDVIGGSTTTQTAWRVHYQCGN
jgi:hypothetical protein